MGRWASRTRTARDISIAKRIQVTYLLDANACIELLNKRESLIAKKLESVSPQDIRLCSVVKADLFHRAYKSRREKNLELARLLKVFHLTILRLKNMANCELLWSAKGIGLDRTTSSLPQSPWLTTLLS